MLWKKIEVKHDVVPYEMCHEGWISYIFVSFVDLIKYCLFFFIFYHFLVSLGVYIDSNIVEVCNKIKI